MYVFQKVMIVIVRVWIWFGKNNVFRLQIAYLSAKTDAFNKNVLSSLQKLSVNEQLNEII